MDYLNDHNIFVCMNCGNVVSSARFDLGLRTRNKSSIIDTFTLYPTIGNNCLTFALVLIILVTLPLEASANTDINPARTGSKGVKTFANINYTYTIEKDGSKEVFTEIIEEEAVYGLYSRKEPEYGVLVHMRSKDNKTDGCDDHHVNVPSTRWIALVMRGGCKFQMKIYNAAVKKNASAVIVYNHNDHDEYLAMDSSGITDVVAIFMNKRPGARLAALLDYGITVHMLITVGPISPGSYNTTINKTSVLFVSISFIVLMIISLVWLVFYYVQRFRYAHAKERLSKRLMSAAKKAITKMPVKTLRAGDKEVDNEQEQCAVCIENYRPSDVIRTLPCKHIFHKSCVDPWLIEQRSCPMCKLDILKAYGLQVHGSGVEPMVPLDYEGPSTSMGMSDVFGLSPNSTIQVQPIHGLQIVHYQPAQVEYHEAPSHTIVASMSSSSSTSSEGHENVDARKSCVPTTVVASLHSGKVSPARSLESLHSDVTERQALMENHDTVDPCVPSVIPHDPAT